MRQQACLYALTVWVLMCCTACMESPEPLFRSDMGSTPRDMASEEDDGVAHDQLPFIVGELPEPPSQDLDACGAARLGADLNICTASYLGGAGADVVTDVAISPDGSVVLSGKFPGVAGYGPLNNEFGFGGDAAVVRLDAQGRRITGWSHVGALISAMDVSPRDGSIVIGGGFGIMALDRTMKQQVFAFPANAPERLDVGFGGEVAWLAGRRVVIYAPDVAEVVGSFDVEEGEISGLVVDSWNRRVVISGFTKVPGKIQQPFVRAHGFDGEKVWSAWDWTPAQTARFDADTRCMALAMGHDGKLYVVGESLGKNTVFARDPRDLSAPAPLVTQDSYAELAAATGAAPIGFVARFDAGTGVLEAGTFLLTRSRDGAGEGTRLTSIAANERGDVLVGGDAACCIEGSAQKRVVGQAALSDESGGAFIAIFEWETLERTLWTSVRGSAKAVVRDVDAWGRAAVLVHEHVAEDGAMISGRMVTHESFFDEPQGGASDVHVTVIPLP